jgi:hypothetical protein
MFLLSDILTYIRRIIKSPSNATITDNLLIDYVNRFVLSDIDARVQLFDYKTNYSFMTIPGISSYNMPLYDVQTEPGSQTIASFPVYQGFEAPSYINGYVVPFYTEQTAFYNLWPNYSQFLNPGGTGDGTTGPYSLTLPYFPAIPGHVDMTGMIGYINGGAANSDPPFVSTLDLNIPSTSVQPSVYITATDVNGQLIEVTDSGQFLSTATDGNLYGLLMQPGNPPLGNASLGTYSETSNTVNYSTGAVNVSFPTAIPSGNDINIQCLYMNQGLPRAVLFYNNTLTIRPPPNISYNVQLTAYLTPAAFLNTTEAIPFGYMSEYIARGAARKILADTGDMEQFQFYEPFFREQEILVWKRSQRIFTATRTPTIFSATQGQAGIGTLGGSTT